MRKKHHIAETRDVAQIIRALGFLILCAALAAAIVILALDGAIVAPSVASIASVLIARL